jgi:hypothetical protein
VPYRFRGAGDLVVERLLPGGGVEWLALGAHFSVTGGQTDAGGTLTRTAATSGARLRIRRRTVRAQPMLYTTGDRFPARSHEEAIDRGILIAQEVDEGLAETSDRALLVPIGERAQDLPPAADRAATALVFDAEGQPTTRPLGSFPAGPAGPASNTRATLAELKAAPASDLSSIYDGSLWTFVEGDFTGRADDVTIVQAGATPLTAGAWVRQVDALTPEMFGARGDGVTNDTSAFQRLGDAISAMKGGAILFGRGRVYVVGRQRFAGATAKRYAFDHERVLRIVGCTNAVTIDLNGSTMRFAAGLRFGAFDPVSGAALAVVAPNYNPDTQAHVGVAIRLVGNTGPVRVWGGFIDGNSANLVLGGDYGDTGRQVVQYGVFAVGNDNVRIDLTIFDSALDGICFAWPGLTEATPPKPHSLGNSLVRNCGRNNVSVIGGNLVSSDDGFVSIAGGMAPHPAAPGGFVKSAPASCIDIEAEDAINRNVVIRGQLIGGARTNTCFVADSGDSAEATGIEARSA